MPTVSIIVPNYNHGRFLEERLESIFNQTFQDFEVILLDDCSTDDSVEILKKYARRSQVKGLYVNEHNSGSTFKQWRQGLALASGEYAWIAESDDIAAPDFLEALVALLSANPKTGIAFCRSFIIDEQSQAHGFHDYSADGFDSSRWEQDFTVNGRAEIHNYFQTFSEIINASSVLFRRKAFPSDFAPAEKMFRCGDWYTWVSILHDTDLVYTARPLNFFRNCRRWDSPAAYRLFLRKVVMDKFFFPQWFFQNGLINAPERRRLYYCFLRQWVDAWTPADWFSREFRSPFHKNVPPRYILLLVAGCLSWVRSWLSPGSRCRKLFKMVKQSK